MQDFKTQQILNLLERINNKTADTNENHTSRMESESVTDSGTNRNPRMAMIIR